MHRPAHAGAARRETILESVARPRRCVIVDEANATCAVGAEVAALIAERAFEDLDGPVLRVADADVPIPFCPPLEQRAPAPARRHEGGLP